jgi:VWFA-related protein
VSPKLASAPSCAPGNQSECSRIVDQVSWYSSVFLLFFGSWSLGQEATIKTTVPLVVVPASVTDSHGRYVYGLSQSDFVLFDNGSPRNIRVDDPDAVNAAFDLVVLIQTSDISQPALLKIRKVGVMIQNAVVGANGEAAVVGFSDLVKVLRDFTNDADEIASTFRELQPSDCAKEDCWMRSLKGSPCSRAGPRPCGVPYS